MTARSPSLCAVLLMLPLFLGALLLGGCGQAGPLYLPEEEEAPAPAQPPAQEEAAEQAPEEGAPAEDN